MRVLENEVYKNNIYCIYSIDYLLLLNYEKKILRIVVKLKKVINVNVIVFWVGDIFSIYYIF